MAGSGTRRARMGQFRPRHPLCPATGRHTIVLLATDVASFDLGDRPDGLWQSPRRRVLRPAANHREAPGHFKALTINMSGLTCMAIVRRPHERSMACFDSRSSERQLRHGAWHKNLSWPGTPIPTL